MEDLGGWNSWRRTFLSVLGLPFPPTTWKVVKITLLVQNLWWKYWFPLLVYWSNLFSALKFKFVAESRWHVPVPITGIKQNHSWELSLPVMRFGAEKSKEDLHGEVTPCKWMDCSISHIQILVTGSSLACIWRVYLEVLFSLFSSLHKKNKISKMPNLIWIEGLHQNQLKLM